MIMGCIEEEIPYEGKNFEEETSSCETSQKSSLSKKSTKFTTDHDNLFSATLSSPDTIGDTNSKI